MGGRQDATNVIDAPVAVITPIGWTTPSIWATPRALIARPEGAAATSQRDHGGEQALRDSQHP